MNILYASISRICVVLAIAISLLGCNMPNKVTPEDSPREPLTAEKARAALIAVVEGSEYVELKMSLPNLRKDEIMQVDQDVISIGKWRCNLKSHTFLVAVDAEPIFAEYNGEFTRESDSTWNAAITSVTRN